jgi:hypothetical protein
MVAAVALNASVTVKQILAQCWEGYAATHQVTTYQRHEVEKALSCYTTKKGCFVYFCEHCNDYLFMTMGCNSRMCSSCGKRYTDQWSESLSKAMFPVPHRHFVLSVSDKLWQYLRKWELMKVYMDAAVAAFNDYFSKLLHRSDVKVGLIVVLHPFGKDMKWYPHLHLLMTEGGFDKNGKFIPVEFIPAEAFRKKWQYEVLTRLKKAGVPPGIINDCFQQHKNGFYVWLHRSGRIAHPKLIAKYIGRYVRHPAIANSRIDNFDGKTVTFHYKTEQEGKITVHTVVMTVDDFITALIQHIPPKQFRMIRYYGAYARKTKRHFGAGIHSAVTQLNLYHFGLERIKNCPFCKNPMTFVCYIKKPPPETPTKQQQLTIWR